MKTLKITKKTIVLLILLLFFYFAFRYINNYLNKSRATGNATITASVSSNNYQVNQEFDVTYTISANNESNKITAIDLNFVTESVLKIVQVDDPVYVGADGGTLDKVTKDITESSAHLVYTTQSQANSISNKVMIRLKLKGISAGSGAIRLENYQITALPPPTVLTFDATPVKNFNFVSEGNTVFLIFEPNQLEVNANDNFNINFGIHTNLTEPNEGITAFRTNLRFNKGVIECVTIQPNDVVNNNFNEVKKTCDNNLGEINLIYLLKQDILNHPKEGINFVLGFKAKSGEETMIEVNLDQTEVTSDRELTINKSDVSINVNTSNPSVTTTPPGSKTFNFNLILKFQGINNKPKDEYSKMTAKVILKYANGQIVEKKDVNLSANENGLWQGKVTFENVDNLRKMRIFIKGPKHLQKRICSLTPEETYPGSYYCSDSFKLNEDELDVTLDARKIALLVGDIDQDGIISAYDIAYVRNNLNKKDEKTLSAADFNLDGIVDSQDYSLLIAALSVKSDEE